MGSLGWVAIVAAAAFLAELPPAHAQQLNLGHQTAPGFIVAPSPTFPSYSQPALPPPPAYRPPAFEHSVSQ